MAVWSVLTPLFAGPDETSNMVKAAAVVRGEWVGTGQPPSVQDAYFRTTVDIDPRFGNPNQIPWCFVPYPERPACERSMEAVEVVEDAPYTNVGRYPPVAYVIPGVATYLGPTNAAMRVARLLNAACTAALLGIGVGIARRASIGLVPLMIVVSPMVLFLGSVANTSGLEVASGLALWMLAGPFWRAELVTRADRFGLWVVVIVLITARPIGAAFAMAILAATWLAHSRRSRVATVRRHWVTALSAVLATAFMIAWYVRVYAVNLGRSVVAGEPSIGPARTLLRAVGHVPGLLAEMVGNFGWLDTPSPSLVVTAWLSGLGAVSIAAFVRADVSRRLAILLTLAGALALSVYLDLGYYRILRTFGVQGRHLLPLVFGAALVAADRVRVGRRASIAVAAAWAAAQWSCGLFALRRYTVGVAPDNLLDVFRAPAWRPRLGVVTTLVLLALTLTIAASLFVASESAATQKAVRDAG